jgi:acyl-CoA reductase-like NAD-dependent aldehyde dehydrogenase
MRTRLQVQKTYKLFVDGKFPRTESGRYLTARTPDGEHIANYCHASRKDLREAVVAARKGLGAWSGCSAYLKSQILYRLAEMIEGREAALAEEIARSTGLSEKAARQEVAASADCCVYYAGWTDKIHQVFGAVNPVASSHFNFTTLEPVGVTGLIAPDAPSLFGSVALLAAALAGGNSVILVPSEKYPLPVATLAEVIATSDVPAGAVNILTGQRAELAKTLAEHMDVNAVVEASGDQSLRQMLREGSALNLKRIACWDLPDGAESPYKVVQTMEAKTAWHPIGV